MFRLAEEVLDEGVKASLIQALAQEESQDSDGMVARYERVAQEWEKNWAVKPMGDEMTFAGASVGAIH